MLIRAAEAGQGLALVPQEYAREEIAAGRLVQVLDKPWPARFIEGRHFGAHIRIMRTVYAERRDVLTRLVRQYLAEFVEPQVPAGGIQMPCMFIRDIPEQKSVEITQGAGIDLLGLTTLHASNRNQAGFLMGFAAHTPHELEIAIKKLANVLRALCR